MLTVLLQLAGIATFSVATVVLGKALRRTPTQAAAHRLSRVSHAFFWGAMLVPELLGVAWPGLTHFDETLGLPSLPGTWLRWMLGAPLLLWACTSRRPRCARSRSGAPG